MIMKQAVLPLTTHATTYSYSLPPGAVNIMFQNREGTEVIQFSFDNFTTYFTLPKPSSGAAANNSGVMLLQLSVGPAAQLIYFQTPTNDGKNVEIQYAIPG